MSTRTRKSRPKNATRRKSAPSFWLTWFTGLIMGSFFTAITLLKLSPSPPSPKPEASASNTTQQSSKEKLAVKPKFDFYTILPNMEVVAPNRMPTATESQQHSPPPAKSPMANKTKANYILQIASFKAKADAEEQKAKLALLGIETNVQGVSLEGETWYRVRQGPFSSLARVDEEQKKLADQHINSLRLRLTS